MLKARGKIDGFDTLFLGLSDENIKRLQAGFPITFAGEPFGCPMNILIFTGKDEKEMAKDIGVDLDSITKSG